MRYRDYNAGISAAFWPDDFDVLQVVNVLRYARFTFFSSEEKEVCGQMAPPLLVHSSRVDGGARSSLHLLDTSESLVS